MPASVKFGLFENEFIDIRRCAFERQAKVGFAILHSAFDGLLKAQ